MSVENVRDFFRKNNMERRVVELDVSSATVELAAEAVGCEPKRIAKSMAFLVEDKPIIVVAAGDGKIANSKYKAKFHTKAKMVPISDLDELIGHKMGGVCPFAVKDGVETYLDNSLKRFDTVFPAAGSEKSVIEMTIEELEKFSNFVEWIDVCKDWE